jgi:acetylornithine deacetylase/succinyl-diaminopimelate desuccinylase-like protein
MKREIPELTLGPLRAFARRERRRYEELLKEFVEMPTVSADPAHRADIERAAEVASRAIRSFGGRVRVFRPRGGNPVIHGSFGQDRRLPTVTLYNHLDVQPASMEAEPWRSEPFRFTKKGDRYFGRGTTDDKGPALAALFGIHAARELDLPVNVRVLWEFEEEIGSPHLEEVLRREAAHLRTDSIVVSDTGWLSRTVPAAPAGLRGFQGFEFILETAREDRHSGDVGGAARNPLGELMELVHEIYDARSGRVKVPGFYDDVVPPSPSELRDFRNSGFSLKAFRKDNRLRRLRTDDPLDVMKRIWAQPTFEIHGVVGGYTGPGVKAIVPGRAEVKASCRLVPNQSPARIARLFKAFVKARHPEVVVRLEKGAQPFKGVTQGPEADAVRHALKFAFGRTPVFIRDGGSIGAVVTMKRILKCPVVFLGLSLPEHGYHAPNENFDWRQASGGMIAFAKYIDAVSRIGRP